MLEVYFIYGKVYRRFYEKSWLIGIFEEILFGGRFGVRELPVKQTFTYDILYSFISVRISVLSNKVGCLIKIFIALSFRGITCITR